MMKASRELYISNEFKNEEAMQTLRCIGLGPANIRTTEHATIIEYKRVGDRIRALEWVLRFCCERKLSCSGII